MAWIPIANIYLLGKLSFNRLIGVVYLLIYIAILFDYYFLEILYGKPDLMFLYMFLSWFLSLLLSIFPIGTVIIALIKYDKLKAKLNAIAENNYNEKE